MVECGSVATPTTDGGRLLLPSILYHAPCLAALPNGGSFYREWAVPQQYAGLLSPPPHVNRNHYTKSVDQ